MSKFNKSSKEYIENNKAKSLRKEFEIYTENQRRAECEESMRLANIKEKLDDKAERDFISENNREVWE